MIDDGFFEFNKLFDLNKNFFDNLACWFYLKNNRYISPHEGKVKYGKNVPISLRDETLPFYTDGSVVLICNSSKISDLQNECMRFGDRLVGFKLKDGKTDAYITVFKKLDGTESVGFAIPNWLNIMRLPYSLKGNTTYVTACQEEGTLPWMVENDKFVEMIPDEILELIGLKEKSSKKELLEELAEIDKELIALRIQQQKLEEKKTAVVEQVVILNDGTDDGIDK